MPKRSSSKDLYKHLLVIRLSAMGDVAMVPHSLRALRLNYPTLKITVLTKGLFAPLFDELDVEVLSIDTKGQHKGLIGLNRLASQIVDLGIDCVADMHGVLRTHMLTSLLAIRGIESRRIHKGRITKWLHLDGGCNKVTKPLTHTVNRYCSTLRKLGFEVSAPPVATKRLRENPLPYDKGEERWIGIAPFSVHEGKRYPLHLVSQVVERLSERYDRVFIHSGGGEELLFAQKMEQNHKNVVAVFAAMKLKGEIDLISMLDCIISMDSFAMHVASLTATPVVSIWGATHPMLGFHGYGYDHEGEVQLDLKCRPCSTYGNKKCRFNDYHCLHKITPDMVLERVDYMMTKSCRELK